MDISKLTEQQKSVMLAKAMGLTVYYEFRHDPYRKVTVIIIGAYHVNSDDYKQLFYEEDAMHYAWQVIRWGYISVQSFREWLDMPHQAIGTLIGEDGFQYALDKLLQLALAADLAPLPDAPQD